MNLLEDIVFSLYGKENVKINKIPNVLCRNKNLSFNLRDGKNLFLKYFNSKRHFKRESFLYQLFEETNLLPTPKVEYIGENFIILERLIPCYNPDNYKIIRDLAKFHSNFYEIEKEINKKLEEKVLFKVDESSIKMILEKIAFPFSYIEKFLRENLVNLSSENQKLIHGDLYINNILVDFNGNLKYIDLENARVDYPEKDIVLIILNNKKFYQNIIEAYFNERRKYEKIYKKEVEFATKYFTIFKLSEMLHHLNTEKDDYTKKLKKTKFAYEFKKNATDLINYLFDLNIS